MKTHYILGLLASIAFITNVTAQTKVQVPVKAYETFGNPPTGFEVNATSGREDDRNINSNLSYVWFGGKVTNNTGTTRKYTLTIAFFDAKGNELGGENLEGTVKSRDYHNLPEVKTVMKADLVKKIYSAKYVLVLKP